MEGSLNIYLGDQDSCRRDGFYQCVLASHLVLIVLVDVGCSGGH